MKRSHEAPVFDTVRIEMLEQTIGASLMRITDRYFNDCDTALKNLSIWLPQAEPEVRALAHQMKGASSSLGFLQLENWFYVLESAMRTQSPIPADWLAVARQLLDEAMISLQQRNASKQNPS